MDHAHEARRLGDAVPAKNQTSPSAYLASRRSSAHDQARGGAIINITKIFGQMGQAGQANYAA